MRYSRLKNPLLVLDGIPLGYASFASASLGCLASAFKAGSPTPMPKGIARRVFVAVLALCLIRVDVPRSATPYIFEGRHWLKMVGINAAANSAEVVKLKTFRNRAFVMLVESSVGATTAISSGAQRAHPNPASGLSDGHVIDEKRYSSSSHRDSFQSRVVSARCGVDALRGPLRLYRGEVSL